MRTTAFVFAFAIIGTLLASIIGLSIYGVILAFSTSIIVGVIALVVEPLPLIIGVAHLLGYNLPQKILEFLQ